MPEHRDRQRIEGGQRTPGHFDKSDLDGSAEAMAMPTA